MQYKILISALKVASLGSWPLQIDKQFITAT